jgi:hypothetical protein
MVFWNAMMEGEKMESHQKEDFDVEVFSPLRILTSPYLKRLLELFFFFLLFFYFSIFSICFLSFFLCSDSGFWWYLRRKITSSKISFQMKWYGNNCGYTSGRRIFRNGVMHTNIVKPWLWRWGSCGYISGGRIFRSGGMHANLSGWG